MKSTIGAIVLFCVLPQFFCEEIRLLDLEPTDAQQYIDKQDTSLKYAPKIDSNVPAVRYLGNEPHNVLEDIYLANQYHGQDGLGGYLYGYSVPDIAKTEKKKAGGDLRGAYNYIAGNGQEIKVEYWDDGTGFHQVDNVPKVLPQQIEDTPEVKAAKEEHQRLWNEQAERNSRPVAPYDSHGNYAEGPLSPQGQKLPQQHFQQQQYQRPSQGQAQQLVSQYQQQRQQYPNPGQNVHYQGSQYQPEQTQNVNKYQQPSGRGSLAGSAGQLGGGQYSGGHSGSAGQLGGQFSGGLGQVSGSHSTSSRPFTGGVGQSGGQYSGGHSGDSGQLGGQFSSGVGQVSGSHSTSSGPFTEGVGQSGTHLGGSGQLGGGQFSGSSGQPGLGQFSSSHTGSAASQLGSGQFSGSVGQSGLGQFSGSHSGSAGSGQYSGGSGQYGSGHLSGSAGQLGGGQFSGNAGQSGSGQFSGSSGQYGGRHSGSGGQYGGGQSSGGQYSASSSQFSSQTSDGQWSGEGEGKYNEEEEEKGPPKGFFYSFDYPVGIIVKKDGGPIQKREGDLKDIYATNKANFEQQLQQGHSIGSRSATGYLVV
ncbi:keratin, type I cytoskeletal 9-like isoform X2 [Tribolium madens]|uniref:keratin, type I cytoskeletal 9-like isoform X2 n=1 Tax=Tribolium madens TaxID=41895 RepID=UPI001CF71F1B|nr:keratin, type I cytoskeletal 9-like isoform X2 [Tribolium madens]